MLINGVLFWKTPKSVNPRRFSGEVKTSSPLNLQQCDVVKAQNVSLYLQRKQELEISFPPQIPLFHIDKVIFFCEKTFKNYPRLQDHICRIRNFQTETEAMFMIQRCKHEFRAANEMRMKKANNEIYFLVIIIIYMKRPLMSTAALNVRGTGYTSKPT